MDMVYQESDHPVAVLEFEFQTQVELDVFSSICDDGFFTFDSSQIEVLKSVLAALADDKWFERAWTLQESVSAGVSMTLLLGCPGLQKSPHFGPTPGDLEISIWDFQNAMVNVRNLIEEALAANIWSDTSDAINASNCADILWNYIPTITPDGPRDIIKRDASHRQSCNAAQALTFLDDRFNSVFPDRLAILANLCDYEYRIDTKVLELPHCSFSICALTLAILIGDMSLLARYRAQDERLRNVERELTLAENGRSIGLVYENDDFDLQSNAHGFSWGPKPSACLTNITYLEEHGALFRLKPATLSGEGLRVCGVLWNINILVNVSKTQREFASRWQAELALQSGEAVLDGSARQAPLIQDFFWSLLHELVESGFHDLARSIWNFIQPLGKDPVYGNRSYRVPPPYSFDDVFGHLAQGATRADAYLANDESDIRRLLSATHLGFDPENEALDRPILERLVIERVCKEGTLACGTPVNANLSQDSKHPRVWFEACKMGDHVFTPFTSVGDGAARSRYRNQAMSWRVLKTGKSADDCDILHCLGRRRGIWRLEGLYHGDYILD
ncbi:hypothetical protein MMC28_004997 [Mycoblastus sanguinarius]|nr:hypothetical protein [Mycoblastus sanguinarius]